MEKKTLFNNLKTAGFTLIEIMVALAILSGSIVVVLQLFSGGLRSIKISDDYLRATILAQNKMKELESKYRFFVEDEGVFEEDDRFHWSVTAENHDLANLYPQFQNLKYGQKGRVSVDKVRLKVFWKTEHGQRQIELVTLKTLALVNSASKAIIEGNYPSALKTRRGLQFGQQDLPRGQSEKEYIKINSSGVKMVIEAPRISGSSNASNAPNISGQQTDIPGNISGN